MKSGGLQPGYTDKRGLSIYTGLSKRTIEYLLKHPTHPLPAYKPCAKLLFNLREVDAWMQQFRAGADLDRLVNETLAELESGK